MKFEISKEVIEKADKCVYDHQCLTKSGCLCTFEKADESEGRLFFIDRKVHSDCPYMAPFGDSCYCRCPVRREIFERYNV
jgi:hypothetical protein